MTKQRKEQYKTLLILAIGLSLIAWRFKLWYLVAGAGVVLVAGLASPFLLDNITKAWMWIGEKIGAVMSRLILTVVFVFFLTPMALIYRLFRKKEEKNVQSYFVERNHTYTAADLEKVF